MTIPRTGEYVAFGTAIRRLLMPLAAYFVSISLVWITVKTPFLVFPAIAACCAVAEIWHVASTVS